MEQPSIEIINNTKQSLKFSLTHTIDGVVPSASSSSIFPIAPSETKIVAWANEGTANLFVWNEIDELIWKGIIPAKVKKPILLSQNGEKVFFDSMELPKDFAVTTSLQNNATTDSSQFFYVMLCLLFLFIIACFVYYFLKK